MEIINLKHKKVSHICKFPPTDNTNFFPIFGFAKTFNFVKRNWIWIGFVSVVSFVVYQVILMRLKWGNWEPSVPPYFYPVLGLGDIMGLAIIGLLTVICAGITWGKAGSSGRTRITRSTSDSVDGFGGARALDYSHAAGRLGKGPLPVSLSKERLRTATFREGAKDRIDDGEKKHRKKRKKKR